MTDKELIRLALLGNKQAQEKLANKFIPIPCAFCQSDGSNIKVQYDKGVAWTECQVCGACGPIVEADDEYTGEKAAIYAHNTRPAPPVGRCGECALWKEEKECPGSFCCTITGMERESNDFCSEFEPREE